MTSRQRGQAEEQVDAMSDGAEPLDADTKRASHSTGRPIATNEVWRPQPLARAGRAVDDVGGHAVIILIEADELGVVAYPHVRKHAGVLAEDWIEIDLRARASRLRRVIPSAPLRIGGNRDAQQFRAAHAVEIDEIARVALWPDRSAHRFGDTPAAAELHVACAHHALPRH